MAAEKDPCWECPRRWVKDGKTCHSTCGDYLEARAKKDRENEERRARSEAKADADAVYVAGARRDIRHRRGHKKI